MKQVVDVGLPPLKQAFSWAVKAKGEMLFMVNGPVRQVAAWKMSPKC